MRRAGTKKRRRNDGNPNGLVEGGRMMINPFLLLLSPHLLLMTY
jgi:hypothetical protein